ncbi:hypothetical protein G6F57_003215 [Rhizopus arrhizus]|uniref:Uncharacterized protein n=1 Tax=Rhizopus oryzae TaxID=64495 RepID=A0A9P7BPX6_RHIOR|nr:hypothetical protein G6F23_007763 [Rhizopus arrhizus]KAG1415919.1 hypothetical protein G6F58_006237 [Rhizopus delemar]KAG0764808.1 hypothetical protein G6F24_004920 [Rhizopus arrhizus]KAG0785193.1 hypothetical protein G6F21_009418 [Rhizopus arrhizus]KAG0789363.1 hypothetical protein G6F22_006730 [Rhizopus arrhizus]
MLLAQLQVQLAEVRKEIKRFKEQNAALRKQHTRATYTQSYTMESSTTVSTPPAALSQRQPHPTKKCLPFNRSYAKDCKPIYDRSLPSQATAAPQPTKALNTFIYHSNVAYLSANDVTDFTLCTPTVAELTILITLTEI